MIAHLLAFDWSWTPGFRGLFSVLVAVLVLCGSVALILATNSGNRLGFMIALTGFCAWMFVMGLVWTMYGIGYKGKAPTWKVVDTVRSEDVAQDGVVDSRIESAQELLLPGELPDPVEVRDSSELLLEAYPPEQRDPSLGDLVTIDTELKDEINEMAAPWRILESSNKYTGETESKVAEALGPDGQGVFQSASEYEVIEAFLAGGKKMRTDDSTVGRFIFKIRSTLEINPPPFYAAVQLQAVIPQETRPGQAPPPPVRDRTQPIITVILERTDGHMLRIPAAMTTLFMGLATGVLCYQLHRRDQLAEAQRAAGAGAR